MFRKEIEEINNPIVYIFLALAISSVCFGIEEDYRGLAIFIAAFFLVCIFLLFDIKFFIIIIIFFGVGLFINSSYYSVSSNVYGIVRINKITSYNMVGIYNGKKVYIDLDNNKLNKEGNKENIKVGERYKIEGKINKTQDRFKGIVGEITEIERVTLLKPDFLSKLYELKSKIYNKLEQNIGERKSGLVSSISFGDSTHLDSEDKEDMKNFGIIHSISVSGLHVAIVYGFLRLFVGVKGGLLLSIVYVIFTGSNYSSIRAFIMLLAGNSAELFHKNKNSVSSLCLSALILTIYKPYSIFEISFHLSYLATLGIILLNKKINDILYKFPNKIRESLSLTFSAQVFTFPYLLIVFKEFSTNFIIGNLILVPFVNIIVILGNLLTVFYKVTYIFDYISYLLMEVINIFDYILDKISLYSLPNFYGNEFVIFFYFFLAISIYFINKGHREFKYLPIISAVIYIMVELNNPFVIIKYYSEGALAVSYKGESIVISNKNKINIDKILKINNTDKVYRNFNTICVNKLCYIKSKNKDYELIVDDKKYLLKMSSSKTQYKDYDIINFKEGLAQKVYILDEKVITSF